VYDAADELRDARLVRDEPTSDLGWTLRPTHDQLADSVRSSLLPSRIAELAGRLGRGLEGSEFAQAEEIGRHHRMAGEMERAREWLARAASQAMDALAWVRALALLEEVLTLTDEPLARSSTLEQMAKAYGGAGRNLDAGDAYLRAAAGATGERAAELRFLAADRRLRGGDLEAGLRAMDTALSDVGARLQRSAPEALASLLYHRARISWRGLEFTPRAGHELDPVTARRVDRLWSAGMGLTSLDSVRGTDFMARALLEALELGDARRIARSLATEAAAVSNRGASTRAEARALLTRAREIGAPIDDPTLRALLFSVECLVDFHAGRLESARRIARRAEDELSTAFAMSREISIACFVELQMLGMMGRFRELAERMDRLLPDVDDRQERYGMAMLRNGFPSHRWLADDDPARALEENRRAASFWPDGPLRVPDFASYFGSVDACLYADDVAAARELVEQFRPKLARTLLRRIEFVDVIALDVQGRVALAMPSERLPTNEVRRTIRHLHAIATPVAKARAEMLAGGLARHAQRREDARAAYLRAEDAAREAELLAVASVARREADRMANLDVSASDDALRQLGVRNPLRLAAMLAPPGFL
jgi:hypothetical protein